MGRGLVPCLLMRRASLCASSRHGCEPARSAVPRNGNGGHRDVSAPVVPEWHTRLISFDAHEGCTAAVLVFWKGETEARRAQSGGRSGVWPHGGRWPPLSRPVFFYLNERNLREKHGLLLGPPRSPLAELRGPSPRPLRPWRTGGAQGFGGHGALDDLAKPRTPSCRRPLPYRERGVSSPVP